MALYCESVLDIIMIVFSVAKLKIIQDCKYCQDWLVSTTTATKRNI
jgi:hypothetical protein